MTPSSFQARIFLRLDFINVTNHFKTWDARENNRKTNETLKRFDASLNTSPNFLQRCVIKKATQVKTILVFIDLCKDHVYSLKQRSCYL